MSTDTQLEVLSQRWAEDPTPRRALQLADLHRQRGDLDLALPILEQGLERHPGHVSIQVALGRYRLEAGDSVGSAKILRTVVDKDPGHLVANKLLVRAHLGLGDSKSAADRLELYGLLNDNDPDLEALRSEVAAATGGSTKDAGPPPLPADFGAAEGPGPDLTRLERPGRRTVTGALRGGPFAELESDPLRPATLPGFFPQVAPQEATEVVAQASATEGAAEVAVEDREDAVAPVETVEIALDPDLGALELGLGDDGKSEPEPDDLAGMPQDQPSETDAGSGATATLGALYLAQGHVAEAKRTFDQVLERDPGDAEARAGLDEIESRTASVETVEEAQNPRIARLERYLSRIRAAAERLSA